MGKCKNCGTPITKEWCEEGYPEGCDHWTPKKPKTNADRIRAMDDELLATQFVQVVRETIEVLTKLEMPDSLLNEIRTKILEKIKEPVEGE